MVVVKFGYVSTKERAVMLRRAATKAAGWQSSLVLLDSTRAEGAA